jgi:LEA14-like dessication related protein
VGFAALKINSLTIGGSDLVCEVSVKNGNAFELLVDRITYDLRIGGHAIDKGNIKGDKNIEGRSEKIMNIPLLLNFFDVGKDVHGLLQKSAVNCSLKGELELRTAWGRITIPFDITEQVSIIRNSVTR